MMNEQQKCAPDPLTKVCTEKAAKAFIESYQADGVKYEGDALFLIHLEGWRDFKEKYGLATGNAVLQQTAFLLDKALKKTDKLARIGDGTFLVYALGCSDATDAEVCAQAMIRQIETVRIPPGTGHHLEAKIGVVLCYGIEKCYDELLNTAIMALCEAQREDKPMFIAKETSAFREAEKSFEIEAIPSYKPNSGKADMAFITELTNTVFGCRDLELGIEMALERMCRYFKVEQAYVVERTADKKYFELTYEWNTTNRLVMNDNLSLIPGLMTESYQQEFDENGIFVCNRFEDFNIINRVMAERQRIRGTKALMQSIILEEETFAGYIGLCDLKEERLWQEEEIATFSHSCKIIAANILQLRSMKYRQRIAYKDSLTGAWNLSRFLLEAEKRNDGKKKRAVVTFDIKNFKVINTEFSYETGNRVLVEVGRMLYTFIEKDECYARIEADAFVLLLFYKTPEELRQRIEQLLLRTERLSAKMILFFPFICMAGVCVEEDEQDSVESMIESANAVRRSIKDYHKSNYAFFNKEMQNQRDREKYFASRMKSALLNREFTVYYQPKIDVASGSWSGLEALVRWQEPDGTLVQPDSFIPLFERNGFIAEIDRYVFEQVCRDLTDWKARGRRLYPVAVNISRVHILEARFPGELVEICRHYNVPVKMIELELTESAFLDNPSVILEIANEIKKEGFKLSMDDFGTGYSSLSMLKDIPVDIVKLDRDFFRDDMDKREKIVVTNVVRMARELDIQVISEGIETAAQEQFLKEVGCNMAQGFYYAAPAPIGELAPVLWP